RNYLPGARASCLHSARSALSPPSQYHLRQRVGPSSQYHLRQRMDPLLTQRRHPPSPAKSSRRSSRQAQSSIPPPISPNYSPRAPAASFPSKLAQEICAAALARSSR